jgi:hypothetical protein
MKIKLVLAAAMVAALSGCGAATVVQTTAGDGTVSVQPTADPTPSDTPAAPAASTTTDTAVTAPVVASDPAPAAPAPVVVKHSATKPADDPVVTDAGGNVITDQTDPTTGGTVVVSRKPPVMPVVVSTVDTLPTTTDPGKSVSPGNGAIPPGTAG